MSKAVSPQPQQSTAWSVEAVHVPLLPPAPELHVEAERPACGSDPRFLHSWFTQRVLTAAGEVESAEWMLDRVLGDAAESDAEIGIGLDVAPLDGALESARWALDQAVSGLNAELRNAAQHGVPLESLARTCALEVEDVRAVLDGTDGEHPAAAAAVLHEELATAV